MYVVEPVDKVRDSGLASTRSTHESHLLASISVKVDVKEHLLFGHIAEIYLREIYLALLLNELKAITKWLFPSPHVSLLCCLNKCAVGILFHIDKVYGGSAVVLALLVHDVEHALGTSQRCYHAVYLIANLRHWLGEVLD